MGTFESIEAGGRTARAHRAGDGPSGVVVLHPWWGLNEDVVAFADRLAGAGFTVVAPDLFDGQVAKTIEEAEGLTKTADEQAIDALVLATVDGLGERLGPDAGLAVLGFSFGAHWALWSPAERDRVAASVVYYGTSDGPFLTGARVPVLGHFAEDDPYESAEWVAEFEEKIRAAGRDVTIHRYPGTGHWFAEPSRDAYVCDAT
jgi:carboxymethylenebutenolidase